ncbi:MAG: urease accessory protein UreE, partial [Mesorhizobium sp.]
SATGSGRSTNTLSPPAVSMARRRKCRSSCGKMALSKGVAAPEEVYDIRARDSVHLTELAWHIGNRHLAAAIEADRILILRDHVIKAMLEGLGAAVSEVLEPFSPVRGAYSGHGHDHGHAHDHHGHDHHDHDHAHGHHDHDHDHHHHHD